MTIVKMGWLNLKWPERFFLIASVLIAIAISYQAMKIGHNAISNQVLGPIALMAFVLQSAFLVGILRFRAKALHSMFVMVLVELRECKAKLGEEVPHEINIMIAGFLVDKK